MGKGLPVTSLTFETRVLVILRNLLCIGSPTSPTYLAKNRKNFGIELKGLYSNDETIEFNGGCQETWTIDCGISKILVDSNDLNLHNLIVLKANVFLDRIKYGRENVIMSDIAKPSWDVVESGEFFVVSRRWDIILTVLEMSMSNRGGDISFT